MNRTRLVIVLSLVLLPGFAPASQVRVDSTSGLELVMTDETADINPYNLGNSAGIVLLPDQTRIQISLPWRQFTSNPPTFHNEYQLLGAGNYKGFLTVSKDHWAFQAGGNLLDYQFQSGPLTVLGQSGSGFAQGAGVWGPLSLGGEVEWIGGGYNEPGFVSNTTNLYTRLGLLASFPLAQGKEPVSLRVGGTCFFNPGPSQASYASTQTSPSPYTVTQTNNNSTLVWAPGLFLEVPGTFQAGVVGTIYGNSENTNFASTNQSYFPSSPTYHYIDDGNFTLNALYKWKIALEASGGPDALTFNNGALFQFYNDNSKVYSPSGNTNMKAQEGTNQFQAGVGLERAGDFTLGAQVNLYRLNGTQSFAVGNPGTSGFTQNQVSLGGEKWVSPQWALRAGLMYEDDSTPPYTGIGSGSWQGFLILGPGEEVSGVMINLGAGFQAKDFQADAHFWFEQPSFQGPSGTPSTFQYTLIGAELSLSLFFGS